MDRIASAIGGRVAPTPGARVSPVYNPAAEVPAAEIPAAEVYKAVGLVNAREYGDGTAIFTRDGAVCTFPTMN